MAMPVAAHQHQARVVMVRSGARMLPRAGGLIASAAQLNPALREVRVSNSLRVSRMRASSLRVFA